MSKEPEPLIPKHGGLLMWPQDDPRRKALVARRCKTADEVALWVKEHAGKDGRDAESNISMKSVPSIKSISLVYAEAAANAALVLIGVATALLDRQVAAQAEAFEKEGGFTERMYRTRQRRRRED